MCELNNNNLWHFHIKFWFSLHPISSSWNRCETPTSRWCEPPCSNSLKLQHWILKKKKCVENATENVSAFVYVAPKVHIVSLVLYQGLFCALEHIAVSMMLCGRSWCGITGNCRRYLSTGSCSRVPSQPRSVMPVLGESGWETSVGKCWRVCRWCKM